MSKNNKEIRDALAARNMAQWQLADKLGIREEALSKMLRYELSEEEKTRLLSVINQNEEVKA